MLAEGLVIVSSILLAFAIDAWWEQRQERSHALEQLVRVESDLRINTTMMQDKIRDLEDAAEAIKEYQQWMGPEPEAVDRELLAQQWDRMMGIGTLSLVRRAIDDFLAGGAEMHSDEPAIREKLAGWYYNASQLESQYQILRQEHWELANYNNRNPRTPLLGITSRSFRAQGFPESAFPTEQAALLNNPVVESLLGNYLMRMSFVLRLARRHETMQKELLSLLAEATAQ